MSRVRKVRSPSYPFLSLPEALERARVLYEKERRNQVNPEVAVAYWGYGPSSSGGRLTRKALELFGLVEGEGAVRLTERALRILLDEEGLERRRRIQEAALLPPLHARLWERYGANLPGPKELRLTLILDEGFNENTVDGFIQSYLETLDFAGLRGGLPEETRPRPTPPAPPRPALPFSTPPEPAPSQVAPATFPLLDGNSVEFRIGRRIRPEEAEEVRALFEIWLRKIVLPG
jgi:hypothetical protein